jgi:hypothetical protein
MQKATYKDAEFLARSMENVIPGDSPAERAEHVWDIIEGMLYNSHSELTMLVLTCLKPLPTEKLGRSGSNEAPKGGAR